MVSSLRKATHPEGKVSITTTTIGLLFWSDSEMAQSFCDPETKVLGFNSTRESRPVSEGLDLGLETKTKMKDQDILQWQGYGKCTHALALLITYRSATGPCLHKCKPHFMFTALIINVMLIPL